MALNLREIPTTWIAKGYDIGGSVTIGTADNRADAVEIAVEYKRQNPNVWVAVEARTFIVVDSA